jgi:hypothetical protein
MLNFSIEPPAQAAIKKKALIVIKARPDTKDTGFPSGIANEVVFMEMTRPILDNLYNVCSVSQIFLHLILCQARFKLLAP